MLTSIYIIYIRKETQNFLTETIMVYKKEINGQNCEHMQTLGEWRKYYAPRAKRKVELQNIL